MKHLKFDHGGMWAGRSPPQPMHLWAAKACHVTEFIHARMHLLPVFLSAFQFQISSQHIDKIAYLLIRGMCIARSKACILESESDKGRFSSRVYHEVKCLLFLLCLASSGCQA